MPSEFKRIVPYIQHASSSMQLDEMDDFLKVESVNLRALRYAPFFVVFVFVVVVVVCLFVCLLLLLALAGFGLWWW
jgi:hypothetical protein